MWAKATNPGSYCNREGVVFHKQRDGSWEEGEDPGEVIPFRDYTDLEDRLQEFYDFGVGHALSHDLDACETGEEFARVGLATLNPRNEAVRRIISET